METVTTGSREWRRATTPPHLSTSARISPPNTLPWWLSWSGIMLSASTVYDSRGVFPACAGELDSSDIGLCCGISSLRLGTVYHPGTVETMWCAHLARSFTRIQIICSPYTEEECNE